MMFWELESMFGTSFYGVVEVQKTWKMMFRELEKVFGTSF